MKKITWGINGSKLNAYLKDMRRANETVVLHTVMDVIGDRYVWLVSAYMGMKVPLSFYKDLIQPYTMTDAPEFGESKTVSGPDRDGANLASCAEDLVSKAEKVAYDTRFTLDVAQDKKWRGMSIFALDDGTPVAIKSDISSIFERGQFVSYWGRGSCSPIVVKAEYGIAGVMMPVRLSYDSMEKAQAICQFYKAPDRSESVA